MLAVNVSTKSNNDLAGDENHHGESTLLTIAIPTFNRCRWLRQALDSVLTQSASDVEIIVSDNASTDGTADIADEYRANGVQWLTQASNVGMVGNWECLLEKAHGRWFLLLSDDDALLPGVIPALRKELLECRESILVGGCIFENYATGREMSRAFTDAVRTGPDFIRSFLLGQVFVVPAAMILKTNDLRQVGGYRQLDFHLVVDAAAWFRIATTGSIRTISTLVARYAVQPGSATTANDRMMREIANLFQQWSEYLNFTMHDQATMRSGLARISTALACRRMASLRPWQRFWLGWSITYDGYSRPIMCQVRHVLIVTAVMLGLGATLDSIRGGSALNRARMAASR